MKEQNNCMLNKVATKSLKVTNEHYPGVTELPGTVAIRFESKLRFDVIYQEFLRAMAKIGGYGAENYGEGNWMKSRLIGNKGPVNHMQDHLAAYVLSENYDHPEVGTDRKYHLAAIAFNAMMEFWYEDHHV